MLIGVPAETLPGETRVAVTPETVKKLKAAGHTLRIQSGAGVAASATDEALAAAGAEITDAAQAWACPLVLKVRPPSPAELAQAQSGATLVGMLNPFDADGLQRIAAAGLTSFALEAAPRTTRAQSMDVLSSQANIAGYKAVMMAADRYQRFFPMLMRFLEFFAGRLPGIAGVTALRYLSRTPAAYSGPILLLIITLSLAGFTASMAKSLDTNLLGSLRVLQAVLPAMRSFSA